MKQICCVISEYQYQWIWCVINDVFDNLTECCKCIKKTGGEYRQRSYKLKDIKSFWNLKNRIASYETWQQEWLTKKGDLNIGMLNIEYFHVLHVLLKKYQEIEYRKELVSFNTFNLNETEYCSVHWYSSH
jgi:hypothetical protein